MFFVYFFSKKKNASSSFEHREGRTQTPPGSVTPPGTCPAPSSQVAPKKTWRNRKKRETKREPKKNVKNVKRFLKKQNEKREENVKDTRCSQCIPQNFCRNTRCFRSPNWSTTQSKISSCREYVVFFFFCFTCIADVMLELPKWQCYVWSKESSPNWNVSLYCCSYIFNCCHRIRPYSSITAEPLTEVSLWCWKHQCSHCEARCLTRQTGRHRPLESHLHTLLV